MRHIELQHNELTNFCSSLVAFVYLKQITVSSRCDYTASATTESFISEHDPTMRAPTGQLEK